LKEESLSVFSLGILLQRHCGSGFRTWTGFVYLSLKVLDSTSEQGSSPQEGSFLRPKPEVVEAE
jgi:hypothetical protein